MIEVRVRPISAAAHETANAARAKQIAKAREIVITKLVDHDEKHQPRARSLNLALNAWRLRRLRPRPRREQRDEHANRRDVSSAQRLHRNSVAGINQNSIWRVNWFGMITSSRFSQNPER